MKGRWHCCSAHTSATASADERSPFPFDRKVLKNFLVKYLKIPPHTHPTSVLSCKSTELKSFPLAVIKTLSIEEYPATLTARVIHLQIDRGN